MWQTDIHKQHIYVKGVTSGREWSSADIKELQRRSLSDEEVALRPVYAFLARWFSSSTFMEVQTSGSTGVPKRIKVEKTLMIRSAVRTCEFLGLKSEDTALLCMDMRYIGAMMMVVRALVADMRLVVRQATGNPLRGVNERIDFLSVVPMQLFNTLQVADEWECMISIPYIIIGGGMVDKKMCDALKDVEGKVYSTYGMTETLSHIALRKINGSDASECFLPLRGVDVSLSQQNTLVIKDNFLGGKEFVTNDVGEVFDDGSFVISGRVDNVINSGGIKIQIEKDEILLAPYIDGLFALSALPDVRLGEALVLLVEDRCEMKNEDLMEIGRRCLPRYHEPKHIIRVKEIPMVGNSKIDRTECRRLAESYYKKQRDL